MRYLTIFSVLLLPIVTLFSPSISQQSSFMLPEDGPVNLTCLNENCASAYYTCSIYPKCSQLLTCLTKCLDGFEKDTTLLKSQTQSCAQTCIFSYADEFFVGLSRCLTDNKCINLPPIYSNCKYLALTRRFQVSDLKGGWWIVRGYHPTYDCTACQHTFDAVEFEDNQFFYRPTFEALTTNDSFVLVNGTIYVSLENTDPGEVIDIDYYFYGFPFHIRWFTLDGTADNSSVLVYYCGNVLQWSFEGSMIMTRSPILPPGSDSQFLDMVHKNTYLPYSVFCKPQITPCPN